jgi:predicted permease
MAGAVRDLDRRSVLMGAAIHVIIALPSLIIGNALTGDEGSNIAVVVVILVLFVAPFLGGAVAARGHRASPFTHGAAAAGIGWAVIVVHALVRAAFGNGISPGYLLATGIVNISVGMLGGYLMFRTELRKEGSDQSSRG